MLARARDVEAGRRAFAADGAIGSAPPKKVLQVSTFAVHLLLIMVNPPHGGVLKDLLVRDASIASKLREESETLPEIILSEVRVTH